MQIGLKKSLNPLEYKIALKTGIAAALSLYLGTGFAYLLDRPDALVSGTWCVLSTLVVLQARLGGTYQAAWERFLGVFIGSIMGGLFTSIFGSNGITLGISVTLTILICSIFQLRNSIRIATLSLSIVMILWGLHPSISPWQFGFYRFLDSSLGILIAVFVSHALWPEQATQKLRLAIALTLEKIEALFHTDFLTSNGIQLQINGMRDLIKESELELLTKTKSIDAWNRLIDHIERIFQSSTALKTFKEYNLVNILDVSLKNHMDITIKESVRTLKSVIQQLKSPEELEPSENLKNAVDNLNEELNRFRMTRTTRQYERSDVERFFVFFYNFRTVTEELIKVQEKVFFLSKRSFHR